MKRPLAILLSLLLFASMAYAGKTWYHGYADPDGKSTRYTAFVSDEILEKTPEWADTDENPPLSARKAIQLATEMKNSIFKNPLKDELKLMSATMMRENKKKWYWLVRFDGEFQEYKVRIPPNIDIVVLMDGTVVKPTSEPYDPYQNVPAKQRPPAIISDTSASPSKSEQPQAKKPSAEQPDSERPINRDPFAD